MSDELATRETNSSEYAHVTSVFHLKNSNYTQYCILTFIHLVLGVGG